MLAIHTLPETGYLRLSQIIGCPATSTRPAVPAIIPVSKSTWWNGVSSGRFPRPVKLATRVTAWRVEDIRVLVERLAGASGGDNSRLRGR
ncbi:MAG TPA: AlpA family phage regulatory protein [Lysobacter sp.]